MAPGTCFAGPASKKIGSLTGNFSDYQKNNCGSSYFVLDGLDRTTIITPSRIDERAFRERHELVGDATGPSRLPKSLRVVLGRTARHQLKG